MSLCVEETKLAKPGNFSSVLHQNESMTQRGTGVELELRTRRNLEVSTYHVQYNVPFLSKFCRLHTYKLILL